MGLILTVDDSRMMRQMIGGSVEALGYGVLEAENGQAALDLLDRRGDEIELILLDVNMPVMDGFQTLQALKDDDRLRHIPVIMVTMLDEAGDGIALGAADYLTKPLSRDGLVTAIRRHLKTPGQVLVVEDDQSTRLLAERALVREGFPVHSEKDGRAAIRWLEDNVPALILLDLLMPDVDGFGVLAWLSGSERHRDVPSAGNYV